MARSSGLLDGPFAGAGMPFPIAGVAAYYPPHWASLNTASTDLTTTVNRLYYIPYYFPVAGLSYTGLAARNLGTGDNTEVFRMGVYTRSSATGLPQTLVIDAGEVTLSGAAADRLLATAWTAPYKGWGFVCAHHNTAADMMSVSSISARSTAVGRIATNVLDHSFGEATTNPSGTGATFGGYYVDTTYAALAATAVAPTAIATQATAVIPYRT